MSSLTHICIYSLLPESFIKLVDNEENYFSLISKSKLRAYKQNASWTSWIKFVLIN